MKKAKIPLMIQDFRVARDEKLESPIEGYYAIQEFFFDGPISKHVAIIDIDPIDGTLNSGVRLKINKGDAQLHYYADEDGKDIRTYQDAELYKPEFLQVSTFATVLKTLDLFEKEIIDKSNRRAIDSRQKYGVLGRALKWAFNGTQLLVIPRAGEMANAYYNRDTHSLEFFYFPSLEDDKKIIYSALSREIVAHETGHAIIDAIAPDLMDAYTPDSLAIHESLADIIALFVSFSSTNLTKLILNGSNGSIREESHFTNLAEEFAMGLRNEERLRNFLNDKNLIEEDENFVDSTEPHALSEVLTGAIYKVLLKYHDSEKNKLAKKDKFKNLKSPLFSASGEALALCFKSIKRILFRALDFLPPGEVTLVEYARAIAAADRVENKFDYLRKWFAKEFVSRGISSSEETLLQGSRSNAEIKVNCEELISSRRYAYDFVKNYRNILLIPSHTNYEIQSCQKVEYFNGNKKGKDMCILKVCWMHKENGDLGDARLPKERIIKMGTTLVLDCETNKIHALLSNSCFNENVENADYQIRNEEYEEAKVKRNKFLKHLFMEGMLKLDGESIGPDGHPLKNVVRGETVNGVLRIHGAGKSLHLCK